MKVDDPDDRAPRIPGPYVAPGTSAEEIDASYGNARVRIRGSDILGVATAIGIAVVIFMVWTSFDTLKGHQSDTREGMREFIGAMKDQTVALREQTCLIRFPENERQRMVETCKQIAR